MASASSVVAGVPNSGSKALKTVPEGETVLLAGQNGPAYFLVPVLGDVIVEDRELRREEEIDREINQVRIVRERRKAK